MLRDQILPHRLVADFQPEPGSRGRNDPPREGFLLRHNDRIDDVNNAIRAFDIRFHNLCIVDGNSAIFATTCAEAPAAVLTFIVLTSEDMILPGTT